MAGEARQVRKALFRVHNLQPRRPTIRVARLRHRMRSYVVWRLENTIPNSKVVGTRPPEPTCGPFTTKFVMPKDDKVRDNHLADLGDGYGSDLQRSQLADVTITLPPFSLNDRMVGREDSEKVSELAEGRPFSCQRHVIWAWHPAVWTVSSYEKSSKICRRRHTRSKSWCTIASSSRVSACSDGTPLESTWMIFPSNVSDGVQAERCHQLCLSLPEDQLHHVSTEPKMALWCCRSAMDLDTGTGSVNGVAEATIRVDAILGNHHPP